MKRLTSIPGNTQRLDGGAMFGNAPKALWTRWTDADELNRIPLACRALLVQEEERNILFEAGIGTFFPPKMKERYGVVEDEHVLLQSLEAAGLGPEDIDVVVLSHMHFDHAGGLLSSYREGEPMSLVFPNCDYLVGRGAWERARSPHPRDRASFIPELLDLMEATGRLHLVDGETHELLGEDYRFHISDGHTPGMMLTEISLSDGPVVFAADLIPGAAWVHLPLSMGYDRFPERLIDEKRELLEGLVHRKGRLYFTHDPKWALGRVQVNEKGKYEAVDCLASLEGLSA